MVNHPSVTHLEPLRPPRQHFIPPKQKHFLQLLLSCIGYRSETQNFSSVTSPIPPATSSRGRDGIPPICDPSGTPQTHRATLCTTKTKAFSSASNFMHVNKGLVRYIKLKSICDISHTSSNLVQGQEWDIFHV